MTAAQLRAMQHRIARKVAEAYAEAPSGHDPGYAPRWGHIWQSSSGGLYAVSATGLGYMPATAHGTDEAGLLADICRIEDTARSNRHRDAFARSAGKSA